MLQSIRDKTQGWVTSTVIGLLIIIFALWGIHGYLAFNANRSNKIVAKIAGQRLRQSDFEKAYQRIYQQNRDYLRKSFSNDEKMVEALRQRTIREWKITQVLVQAALKSKYRINQTLIDSFLLQIPAFQSASHFSIERFYDVLQAINYTKLEFLEDVKKTLLINQVQQGITQSAFALPEDVHNYIAYSDQKRDFSYLIIPYSIFLNQQNIPDSKIFAYYQQNKLIFNQPEQVSIEYIQLSLKDEKDFLASREQLANLTYTHPDSLAIAGNELGLKIHSIPFFDKTGGKEELSKNSKIIAAAFNQDVLQGNNSAVIDINPNTAIVLRVKKYSPAHLKPFNEIKGKIKIILNKQLAVAEAEQFGKNLLKNWHKTEINPMKKENKKLKWHFIKQIDRYNKKLDKEIVDAIFLLTSPGKHVPTSLSIKGFRLKNGDYILLRLIAIHDEKNLFRLNNKASTLREAIANDFGKLDYTLYAHSVLKKFNLTLNN